MPWQLLLSTIPIMFLLFSLLHYELKSFRYKREQKEEEEKILVPMARRVQKKHTEKHGHTCKELEREFPELQQAK